MVDRPSQRDLLDLLVAALRNFAGRPAAYFGRSESNPSALKLWITSRTRSGL